MAFLKRRGIENLALNWSLFLPLVVRLLEPALRLLVADSPTPVTFSPKLSRLASFGVLADALMEFTLVFTFSFSFAFILGFPLPLVFSRELAIEPLDSSWRREPLLQLLLPHGRFWLRSTLHSHCTDSVARWSPMAPLSCVNSVRGLSEPPELHQRLGSGSWQPLAVRSAAGGTSRFRTCLPQRGCPGRPACLQGKT